MSHLVNIVVGVLGMTVECTMSEPIHGEEDRPSGGRGGDVRSRPAGRLRQGEMGGWTSP